MTPTLLLSLALVATAPADAPLRCDASIPAAVSAVADSTLLALFDSGETYDEFLAAAQARRELWLRNTNGGRVPADALAAAQALPGRWRLLVVAVAGCSDSVNTVPFLALLAAQVPQLELRIITPEAGAAVTATRRTPDGRVATPTVILLNEAGDEVGCWIERPSALQARYMDNRAGRGNGNFFAEKQGWYDADAGVSTVREVVALLQRGADGARGCDAPTGSGGL